MSLTGGLTIHTKSSAMLSILTPSSLLPPPSTPRFTYHSPPSFLRHCPPSSLHPLISPLHPSPFNLLPSPSTLLHTLSPSPSLPASFSLSPPFCHHRSPSSPPASIPLSLFPSPLPTFHTPYPLYPNPAPHALDRWFARSDPLIPTSTLSHLPASPQAAQGRARRLPPRLTLRFLRRQDQHQRGRVVRSERFPRRPCHLPLLAIRAARAADGKRCGSRAGQGEAGIRRERGTGREVIGGQSVKGRECRLSCWQTMRGLSRIKRCQH